MIILYILIAVITLLCLRAASMSANFTIERKITIAQPVSVVYDYVKLLRNHKQFNKWTMADPQVQITYTGTDAEVGFSSHWLSENKNVGEGIQRIIAIEPLHKIEYALEFEKPFKDTAGAYLSLSAEGNSACQVAWGFTGKRKFMQKLMHLVLNLPKMLGNDLQISLENLKLILEK